MWILDTGCGYDLIGQADLSSEAQKKYKSCNGAGITLDAAGGVARSKLKLPMRSRALKGKVEPYVLASSPAVLSLGRRCLKDGYSFTWPPFGKPSFRDPEGRNIPLDVYGFIPYSNKEKGRYSDYWENV